MNSSAKLPRSRMLKTPADIGRGLKYGKRFSGKYMSIYLVPAGIIRRKMAADALKNESGESYPSFAVLVRKKCGKAHRRNRLKRLAREYYRLNQNRLPGFAAVIFSLERNVGEDADLMSDLEKLIGRIGVFLSSRNSGTLKK